ncbi:PQQ-binding-like beta-propeller repeat protein [Streptomyces noursei]|uniref:serine/threonine-protein kinase n=1 Tax=Streptomyces noursei TaxID=1971 RepID=UPI003450B57E
MTVRVLGDRYELVRFVGRGGMGEVWEGRDRVIERRVAIKLLPPHHGTAASAELFFREARTAGGLNHRGVVTVHDVGRDRDDGTLFLVMEFVVGQDLAAVLRQDGPPPVPVAADWGAQTAAALAAAHDAGIVHRDLKPANLMLTAGGDVKVLDFGIARFMAATDKSSKVMGTLAYMAPERFREHGGDARTDLYALGCVLYELLTGAPPFQASDPVAMMAAHVQQAPDAPSTLRPGIPAAVDDLVVRLLAKDPADRPASAAEVHDALRTPTATAGALPTPAAAVASPNPTSADPAPASPPPPAPVTDPDPAPDPHQLPTQTATPPRPGHPPAAGPEPARPQSLGRRRALRLAVGAALVAGAGTGLALLPWGDGQDPSTAAGGTGGGGDAPATARTGVRPWHVDVPMIIPPGPVLSQGVLYLMDGPTIHAVDARTGTQRAALTVQNSPLGSGWLAAAGGTLFAVGAKGRLYALNGADGRTVWTFAAGNDIGCDPTVAGAVVYVGSLDKNLYAVDAATGAKKWAFPTDDFVLSTATVSGGTVYVGGDDKHFYAVDAATGTKKWAFRAGGTFRATAAVAHGTVYVPNNDQRLYALDAATGAQRWSAPLGGSATPDDNDLPSCPVATADTLYVGGRDGLLHALDPTTGRSKWTYRASGDFRPTTPAVADGTVYVGNRADRQGTLHAVDAATGSKRWSVKTGGALGDSYAPIVADGLVYLTNRLGLHAFPTAAGPGRK